MLPNGIIYVMSNEMKFQGIRLAHVHFSVTTPREPARHGVSDTVAPASSTVARTARFDRRSRPAHDHAELAA